MAKAIYVGVGGAARKMKKAYISVNGAARKVKKMYIGVEGKARLCYSAELEKTGTAASLSVARYCLSSASTGAHVLFAGGANATKVTVTTRVSDAVDAYNASLTRTSPTGLSEARFHIGAASVGGYAVFAGGATSNRVSSKVDAYNAALTRTSAPDLVASSKTVIARPVSRGLAGVAGGSVGNYAVFAGGARWSSSDKDYDPTNNCNAYDASLTRTSTISLSTPRYCALSASVGSYVLFAGGHDGYDSDFYGVGATSCTTTVEAFNSSLTRTSAAALSDKAYDSQGVSFGGYALFPGVGNTIDAYNSSLTRTSIYCSKGQVNRMGGTSAGEYAIFAGGYGANKSNLYAAVYIYDASLTYVPVPGISMWEARRDCCGGTVGEHALFAGGLAENGLSDVVDVYTA